MQLLVNEIFYSIQGETRTAGLTSLFIRLSGCNLKCRYCDTKYARDSGSTCSINKILTIAEKQKPFNHVTITGGEPLIQNNTQVLINKLIENDYDVQIETNGSISYDELKFVVSDIVDCNFLLKFIKENIDNIKAFINISPVSGEITPEELSLFIINNKLNARLNLQIHKLIWNNVPENKIAGNLLE